MNTAHLVAWLTCIALAFFACILGVRNAGVVLALERQVEAMDERLQEGSRGPAAAHGEMDRIRRSLDRIGEELAALQQSDAPDISPQLRQRLEELEQLLRETQDRLSALPTAEQ